MEVAINKKKKRQISLLIPTYFYVPAALCLLVNCLAFYGVRILTKNAVHIDMTTALDRKIPFHSGWVIIYILSFAFWMVGYIMTARRDKEYWYRFVTADIIAKLGCGVLFVLLPTTLVRPEITNHQIVDGLLRFIYTVDSPTELFPSIHCLESWFIYIGVRGSVAKEKIPSWFANFSLIFAILVFASTQFTKQHVLADIPSAVLFAEIAWQIANRTNLYQRIEKSCEKITRALFGQEE